MSPHSNLKITCKVTGRLAKHMLLHLRPEQDPLRSGIYERWPRILGIRQILQVEFQDEGCAGRARTARCELDWKPANLGNTPHDWGFAKETPGQDNRGEPGPGLESGAQSPRFRTGTTVSATLPELSMCLAAKVVVWVVGVQNGIGCEPVLAFALAIWDIITHAYSFSGHPQRPEIKKRLKAKPSAT
eukprot:1095188-Pelagomonas_calceolata.AAC.4